MDNIFISILLLPVILVLLSAAFIKPKYLIILPILSYKIVYEVIIFFNLTIQNSVASQTALRISALCAGVCCLIVIFYFLINKISLYNRYLFPFFIFINLFGLFNGFYRNNDLVYNIGDFFNLFQIYIFTLLLLLLFEKGFKYNLIYSFLLFSFVADLFYFFQYANMLIDGPFLRIMGGNVFLALLSFYLIYTKEKRFNSIYSISFIISFLTILMAGYRGKWLLFVLGIILIIVMSQKKLSFTNILRKVASSAMLVFFIFTILYQIPTFKEYFNKRVIEETIMAYKYDGDTESESQKSYEVFKILQYFNNNPSSLLLGFGSGAEIEIDKNVGKYILKKWDSRGTLHYIHNTYFSILFRYGIIGLLFFLYFIFKLCRIGFDKNKSKDKIDKFALVYLLICIIGFTQDFMIGVYLGILEWPFIFAMIINYKKNISTKIEKNVQTV